MKQCRSCNRISPSQSREEVIPAETPDFPFQDIAVDFFKYKGRNFAALCDRYSGFLVIQKSMSTDFNNVIELLKNHLRQFEVPALIDTDGGPVGWWHWGVAVFPPMPQSSTTKWGIAHRLSTAMYPESNSRTEQGVKVVKQLAKILEYATDGPARIFCTDCVLQAHYQQFT